MSSVFESAPSGRAKCRGCGRALARGELRFGERLPNPYAEGETTIWFHPTCAAFKRPEPFLAALAEAPEALPERATLARTAEASAAHRRLARIDGAERAPSNQAKCRACRQPIARGSWRIRLVFFEEGRFSPGGTVHVACHRTYFEGHEILPALLHFTLDLAPAERADLEQACAAAQPPS